MTIITLAYWKLYKKGLDGKNQSYRLFLKEKDCVNDVLPSFFFYFFVLQNINREISLFIKKETLVQ